MKAVSMDSYREATDNYQGWCSVCEDFTRDATEPDAEGYDCPKCEGNTVMGAEQALVVGEITIAEDSHE